jgi:hypothetical protein
MHAVGLTPKFSRMRRRRNSPPRRSLAPHVGCNATLGEAAVRQRFTRGVPEWLRVLGSRCCTSEACPSAVRLSDGRNGALNVQSLVCCRTSTGQSPAVELSAARMRDAACRRSPEGGVPLLWMGASCEPPGAARRRCRVAGFRRRLRFVGAGRSAARRQLRRVLRECSSRSPCRRDASPPVGGEEKLRRRGIAVQPLFGCLRLVSRNDGEEYVPVG